MKQHDQTGQDGQDDQVDQVDDGYDIELDLETPSSVASKSCAACGVSMAVESKQCGVCYHVVAEAVPAAPDNPLELGVVPKRPWEETEHANAKSSAKSSAKTKVPSKREAKRDAWTCERCDYDLNGLAPDAKVCPECGGPIKPKRAGPGKYGVSILKEDKRSQVAVLLTLVGGFGVLSAMLFGLSGQAHALSVLFVYGVAGALSMVVLVFLSAIGFVGWHEDRFGYALVKLVAAQVFGLLVMQIVGHGLHLVFGGVAYELSPAIIGISAFIGAFAHGSMLYRWVLEELGEAMLVGVLVQILAGGVLVVVNALAM